MLRIIVMVKERGKEEVFQIISGAIDSESASTESTFASSESMSFNPSEILLSQSPEDY